MHSERTDKDEEASEGTVTRMSSPVNANVCCIYLWQCTGSIENIAVINEFNRLSRELSLYQSVESFHQREIYFHGHSDKDILSVA